MMVVCMYIYVHRDCDYMQMDIQMVRQRTCGKSSSLRFYLAAAVVECSLQIEVADKGCTITSCGLVGVSSDSGSKMLEIGW
jgi:type IV secretory pathway VirB3-like protein